MVYTTAQINPACLLMKEKDMLIPPTGAGALYHSFIFSKMGRRLAVLSDRKMVTAQNIE